MKFASRYNPHEPRKYASSNNEESLTQQQFKEECDVNNILAKYRKTGMVSHLAKHQGDFGDFSGIEDYQSALDKTMRAQESFMALPSELRSKFQNDPAQLIAFINDPANDAESVKFGLIKPPKEEVNFQSSMEKALENNDKKRKKSE